MADICMCRGEGCQVKDRCHRHTAKQSTLRQAWFTETPGRDDQCEHYWPVNRTDKGDSKGRRKKK